MVFLRPSEVIFYHPLDDFMEFTQSDEWVGSGAFVYGKIGDSISALTSDNLSVGPEYEVDSDNYDDDGEITTALGQTIRLSPTKVCLLYPSGTLLDYWGAKLAVVDGTDIVINGDVNVYTGASGIEGARITATKMTEDIVTAGYFMMSGISAYCSHTVLDISGSNITDRYSQIYNNSPNYVMKSNTLCALDSIRFLSCMGVGTQLQTNNNVVCSVGTIGISGISFGPEIEISGIGNRLLDTFLLDTNKAVLVYRDEGDNDKGKARIITIDGTIVISSGIPYQFTDQLGILRDTNYESSRLGNGVALDPDKFIIIYPYGTGYYSAGRIIVGSVSGETIAFGSENTFLDNYYNHGQIDRLSNEECIAIYRDVESWPMWGSAFVVNVSGNTSTFGPATHYGSISGENRGPRPINTIASLDSSTTFVMYSDYGKDTLNATILGLQVTNSDIYSTSGLYPSISGCDKIVLGCWSRNLVDSIDTKINIKKGYNIGFTSGTVSLGSGSVSGATWNDSGISNFLSAINNGINNFCVLSFTNFEDNNWNLKTSLNGNPYIDQGTQNIGNQGIVINDMLPEVIITSGVSSQWIDELILWAGDSITFDDFTNDELSNLYDLAQVYDLTMDQYGELQSTFPINLFTYGYRIMVSYWNSYNWKHRL